MGTTMCASCDGLLSNICLNSCQTACNQSGTADLECSNALAVLVDRSLTILSVNLKSAQDRGPGNGALVGRKLGEALGCLPASIACCGEACACDGCGVKRLVEITRITGETLREVPVALFEERGRTLTLVCATHRVGDAVVVVFRRDKPSKASEIEHG